MIIIKFQWLKDYQELDEEIAYLKWNIRKTKFELIRWEEGDLSKVFLERDSKGSQVEVNIDKLEELLNDKIHMQESLVVLINTFKGIESQILKKKYVDGKTLEAIAEELNYSYGHIKLKHAELKRRLDFIGEYEEAMKKYHLKDRIAEHLVRPDKVVSKKKRIIKCKIKDTSS